MKSATHKPPTMNSIAKISALCMIVLAGCAGSDDGSDTAKENELLKKELELARKEAELKEKEVAAAAEKELAAAKEQAAEELEKATKEMESSSESETAVKKKPAATTESSAANQSDPKWVMSQVFKAAKSNNMGLISNLCDPLGQGNADAKSLCELSAAPPNIKQEFINNFKLGQVVGKPVILGDKATVTFMWGPQGNKPKTMKMVNRKGKWYLSSY